MKQAFQAYDAYISTVQAPRITDAYRAPDHLAGQQCVRFDVGRGFCYHMFFPPKNKKFTTEDFNGKAELNTAENTLFTFCCAITKHYGLQVAMEFVTNTSNLCMDGVLDGQKCQTVTCQLAHPRGVMVRLFQSIRINLQAAVKTERGFTVKNVNAIEDVHDRERARKANAKIYQSINEIAIPDEWHIQQIGYNKIDTNLVMGDPAMLKLLLNEACRTQRKNIDQILTSSVPVGKWLNLRDLIVLRNLMNVGAFEYNMINLAGFAAIQIEVARADYSVYTAKQAEQKAAGYPGTEHDHRKALGSFIGLVTASCFADRELNPTDFGKPQWKNKEQGQQAQGRWLKWISQQIREHIQKVPKQNTVSFFNKARAGRISRDR